MQVVKIWEMFNRKDKKGIEIEVLVWWLIAFAVFVLVVAAYIILRAKGISIGEFVKNLFRFGG
jgi:hypothetical protein